MNMHYLNKGHCLLFVLLLCFVPYAAGTAAPAAPPDILQTYQDVLLGKAPYIQCNLYDGLTQEAAFTDEIASWYGYLFDPPFTYVSFSVTDLDSDGSPELLLALSEDFGYELLRYQDGRVYGFPFFARAMEAVTADGEIHASSGAENFGWYRAIFNGDTMQTDIICWKDDEESPAFHYQIGGAEGTEADFNALNNALLSKETIGWTDYTPENIGSLTSGL